MKGTQPLSQPPSHSQPDIARCILRLHVVGECPLACQMVALEVDVGESWGLAQLDGDWACQLVVEQAQLNQGSQLAQLGGDLPCQLVGRLSIVRPPSCPSLAGICPVSRFLSRQR